MRVVCVFFADLASSCKEKEAEITYFGETGETFTFAIKRDAATAAVIPTFLHSFQIATLESGLASQERIPVTRPIVITNWQTRKRKNTERKFGCHPPGEGLPHLHRLCSMIKKIVNFS